MENTSPVPGIPSQLPEPPPYKPPPQIPISRITVVIALLLFAIGLGLYASTAEETQVDGSQLTQRPPTTTPGKVDRVAGQINVKFNDGVTDEQITDRLKTLNASIKEKIPGVNVTVINVPSGQEEAVLKELIDDPLVKYAEPDFVYYLQFTPNDPNLGNQWELQNTGQMVNGKAGIPNADLKALQAWDVTRGAGVRVAVLDSGIDLTHPEFINKIVATKAFASSSPIDIIGHGTHVAGIVAAAGNNSQGISGVCPECLLLIGKITTEDDSGSVPTSAIGAGITWAADNNAQVINLSIAGPNFSQTVQDAVNYAWSKNAVLISAAGNNSSDTISYPAGYANVISVANTNSNDILSATSNFGRWVTVAAPGDNIYSTYPTTPNSRDINDYGYSGGTSMASPAVAGVTALIWSTQFGTSNTTVIQRLITTADTIPGTGTLWTYGRVNAAKAVGAGQTPPVIPTRVPTPTITVTPTQIPTPKPTASGDTVVALPTFVCAGSGSGVCPTTPPAYPQETPIPVVPTQAAVYPTEKTAVTRSVSVSELIKSIKLPKFYPEKIRGSKHHKKSKGAVDKYTQLVVAYFYALFQKIAMLISAQ